MGIGKSFQSNRYQICFNDSHDNKCIRLTGGMIIKRCPGSGSRKERRLNLRIGTVEAV